MTVITLTRTIEGIVAKTRQGNLSPQEAGKLIAMQVEEACKQIDEKGNDELEDITEKRSV